MAEGERTTEGSEAYLDLARFAAMWQRDRAESYERKAVALLGFAGVIVALLPRLLPLIDEARGGRSRALLKAFVLMAAALLFVSAAASLSTLRRRGHAAPVSLDQLRDEWTTYRDKGGMDAEVINAMFANMFIGEPDHPLHELSAVAGAWRRLQRRLLVPVACCYDLGVRCRCPHADEGVKESWPENLSQHRHRRRGHHRPPYRLGDRNERTMAPSRQRGRAKAEAGNRRRCSDSLRRPQVAEPFSPRGGVLAQPQHL